MAGSWNGQDEASPVFWSWSAARTGSARFVPQEEIGVSETRGRSRTGAGVRVYLS